MPMKVFLSFRDDPHLGLLQASADCKLVPVLNTGNTVLDVMLHVVKSVGLCLAFVESRFNISKGNENTDGSFDYGSFQIYRHFCCKDYRSHAENICHEDCQGIILTGSPRNK
ncbi:Lysozyme-like protein 6 [Vulpes lagopus]